MSFEKNKMYIGNLSYDVSEQELGEFLSEKGIKVQSLNIVKDKYTDRSKGFGFAEVGSEEEMQTAIEALNGQEFKGRPLTVSQARAREERKTGGRPKEGQSRNSSWKY